MDQAFEKIKTEFDQIVALAESENRDLTPEEQKTCDSLINKMENMELPSAGRKTEPNQVSNHKQPAFSVKATTDNTRPLFKNIATGEIVRGYCGTAPMNPDNDAPLGDVLTGLLLNDLSGLPRDIQASLTTGSDTGGGYLVAPQISQRVIDLARANSVVMKAGATTIPMATGELHLARLTADPSVAWRGETGAVTASKPAFGKYVLRPKTCAAIVPVSMELLEDTANAGTVIQSSLTSALGVEVDRALLEGIGAGNETLGIVNNTEVNTQTSVGTPTTYGQITTAITSILNANYQGDISSLAWIMNPTIGGTYDGLKTGISSDNTPLEPTPWVRQLRRMYTTNLAATGSPQAYNMVIGDFRECLVGMRTSGVVIDVLDSGSVTDTDGDTWNATTQYMRFVRARIRVDAVLMRPTWFSVLSGVNA